MCKNICVGKTTVAAEITKRINERQFAASQGRISTEAAAATAAAAAAEKRGKTADDGSESFETVKALGSDIPVAAFVPMDGYHLSRAQLSAMPDPERAHARRGAAFTFDGDAFLALVRQVREPLTAVAVAGAGTGGEGGETSLTVYAPSFDHAVKDPVADDIAIAPTTRVLFFEGNYLSLDRSPWKDAARLMDELWFVDVEVDVARERLVKRHVQAGIAADETEARKRVEENDLVNGREILGARLPMDEIIFSR